MKGLRLLLFPNVPGATFIQGATLIPESRVVILGQPGSLKCMSVWTSDLRNLRIEATLVAC